MQLILHFIVWKFLWIICFHEDWSSKRKCCFLIEICTLYMLTDYIVELNDLFIFLKETEMTVTSCRIYAGLHNARSLLHSEQWYILASNIYVHFNLYSHFSSAVPLVMIEISFIIASFKGHPGFEKKTGRGKVIWRHGLQIDMSGKYIHEFPVEVQWSIILSCIIRL